MRITMICIGSTGDVRPYIILGRELKARGHDVAICAFSPFEQTVLNEGMRYKRLRGDVKDFMASLMNGASGVMFLKQAKDALVGLIDTILEDLEAACEDAEAICATFLGEVIQSIAEVKKVPYIQTPH